MKEVVAALLTVCGVVGLMVPLLPAEGVTVQVWMVWMFAEQLAVEPPPDPAQVQVQGPVPPTVLAVPAVHRLVVGAEAKVPPLDEPQTPMTTGLNVAATVQFAVIAFVV